MKIVGQLRNSPQNVSYLANERYHSVPFTTIKLVMDSKLFNTKCITHVPQKYYDNYVMTTTCSETIQKLQANQAETLAKYCDNPTSIVEIGCGDGSFLKHCSNHFKKVIGIEPSFEFGEEARKKGFKIICEYVSSKKKLFKGKFNAFASRQVFEHLKDPIDVLTGIKYMLKEGAIGLIEVPNGYRALRNNRFYEFFPDHIQYYSVNYLVEIATKTGFNVISCNETFGGDYLELWVRWEPNASVYLNKMSKSQSTLSRKIEKFIKFNHKVAIFGAGAKTLSILSTLNLKTLDKIICVVDDDIHKWNKFIPNSGIPITDSKGGCEFFPENILILALSYIDEITVKLRKYFPYSNIFTIKKNIIVQL